MLTKIYLYVILFIHKRIKFYTMSLSGLLSPLVYQRKRLNTIPKKIKKEVEYVL